MVFPEGNAEKTAPRVHFRRFFGEPAIIASLAVLAF
jgi:hypothetical protein